MAVAQGAAAATVACTDPCLKVALASLNIRSLFLSSFELRVRVKNAVVTLDGTVSDEDKRDLAVEITRGIEGVREAVDHLQIDPESAPPSPGNHCTCTRLETENPHRTCCSCW